MIASSDSENDTIRRKIDLLLDAGIDLDQIAILTSEIYPDLGQTSPKSVEAMRKIAGLAKKNAEKIQEARELILTL